MRSASFSLERWPIRAADGEAFWAEWPGQYCSRLSSPADAEKSFRCSRWRGSATGCSSRAGMGRAGAGFIALVLRLHLRQRDGRGEPELSVWRRRLSMDDELSCWRTVWVGAAHVLLRLWRAGGSDADVSVCCYARRRRSAGCLRRKSIRAMRVRGERRDARRRTGATTAGRSKQKRGGDGERVDIGASGIGSILRTRCSRAFQFWMVCVLAFGATMLRADVQPVDADLLRTVRGASRRALPPVAARCFRYAAARQVLLGRLSSATSSAPTGATSW